MTAAVPAHPPFARDLAVDRRQRGDTPPEWGRDTPPGWGRGRSGTPSPGGSAAAVRLLAALSPDRRPLSLPQHLDHYGQLPPRATGPADLILVDLVERAGLLGRGGAGFPTGRKLRAVAERGGRPVVVANGMEGEPASSKDSVLLGLLPHLVLDGVVVAARAVGAADAYLCVHPGSAAARTVRAAAGERQPAADGVRIQVEEVPGGYVASEESALVHWLSGGPAVPLFTPPRPYERGVRGRPTLVQNVETLAQVALIARYGPDWFRAVGAPGEPGTMLVTVGGAVARSGVVEVPTGTPVGQVLAMCGDTREEVSAVLVGGYFGGWLPAAEALPMPLAHAALATAGLGLGAGILVALPASACGLAETARVASYLAAHSAGQCGPCRNALPSIAQALGVVAHGGVGAAEAVADIERWSALVAGRGACRLPDGATRFVASAWRSFAADAALHTRWGRCAGAGAAPMLPVPAVPAVPAGQWRGGGR